MENNNGIYSAILRIMEDVGAIGKKEKNDQQKFMYRGIDAVMNALQPAMIKNGVFVAPSIIEQRREERKTSKGNNLIYSIVTVKYTFYSRDGSSIDVIVIGEGMDSGDKATNKAMSAAFKYACFQLFCIPTEEMKDPDAETPPESSPKVEYIDANERKTILKLLKLLFDGDIDAAQNGMEGITGYQSVKIIPKIEFKHIVDILNNQLKIKGAANG